MSNPNQNVAPPRMDHRGRKRYDFKNITMSTLLDIGFSSRQYTEFKDECEQLCGANHEPDARASTAPAQQRLYDLAKKYLFSKWNILIDNGVQQDQQKRFWQTYMSTALRNYTTKAKLGKWKQTKQFPDTSIASSSTTTTSLPVASAPPSPPHTHQATDANVTPNISEANSARGAPPLLRYKSKRQSHNSHDKVDHSSLTWRDVRLCASFRHVDDKIRTLEHR